MNIIETIINATTWKKEVPPVDENLSHGSALAVIKLLKVVCALPLREEDREHMSKSAVKWFLNLAAQMGIEDAHVQAEFVNHEQNCEVVYTPLNDSARRVKDYLLQCELETELSRG